VGDCSRGRMPSHPLRLLTRVLLDAHEHPLHQKHSPDPGCDVIIINFLPCCVAYEQVCQARKLDAESAHRSQAAPWRYRGRGNCPPTPLAPGGAYPAPLNTRPVDTPRPGTAVPARIRPPAMIPPTPGRAQRRRTAFAAVPTPLARERQRTAARAGRTRVPDQVRGDGQGRPRVNSPISKSVV
jgi:hypothetical protein